MSERQRQRIAGVAGLGFTVVVVVVGIVLVSWQVIVMAGLVGVISVLVLSGRGAALESWSDRFEGSRLGAALSLGCVLIAWVWAIVSGTTAIYGVALVLTASAISGAIRVLRHKSHAARLRGS